MSVAHELAPKLAGVLEPALGAGTAVENLRTLTGGASRTTWAFDAVTGGQRRSLILRIGPPDEVHAGMELEARAQAAAAAAGAPVPHIVVADDSVGALGNPFLICDAIDGETIVRRIQRQLDDDRPGATAAASVRRGAGRHPPRRHGPARHEPSRIRLAEWREQLDTMGDTTATFEWAFRWLAANRPAPSPPRLVHGDFRMGNLIVDGSGLAAVLDWELVHVGEVYEDLAWFCIRAWRFGAPLDLAAGGLGSIEDFLHGYEKAAGATVDRTAFHWWLVLATLRWGVICRYQAERHSERTDSARWNWRRSAAASARPNGTCSTCSTTRSRTPG